MEIMNVGPFSLLESQLAWLSQQCCGPRASQTLFPHVQGGQLESTPLLKEDDGFPMDAPGVICLSPPPESASGLISQPLVATALGKLLVMRHAHRADEDDESWTAKAARPWDPPLSNLGRSQAREAGQQMLALQPTMHIDYVITSPYLRCLQTSAEVVKALDLPQGRWLVDWCMGEIAEPRLLLGGRPDIEEQVQGRALESWMWGGSSSSEALRRWYQNDASTLGVEVTPVMLQRPAPPFPETRESAMGRYEQEFTWISEGGRGLLKGNCLVVTHGEAVRCAVNVMDPMATVYEVKHCGHVLLERGQSDDEQESGPDMGAGGRLLLSPGPGHMIKKGWQLSCKSGESGVSWFA